MRKYISFIDLFIDQRTFCHQDTAAYIIPKWKSFEVDDLVDFICTDAIIREKTTILESENVTENQ